MAFNLIESFRNLLTPEVVEKAASQYGESSSGINKALTGAIPAILAGFVHKAETGDADSLLRDAKDAANNNLSNFSEGGSVLSRGMDLLNNIFGNRLGNIGDALASFAGIKSSSANSLLGMLAPVGLGVLGKHAVDNNMSTSSFTSFLTEQKASILSALPAGLNLGLENWLGGGADRLREATTGATTTVHRAAGRREVEHKAPQTNWLLTLILILVAIALLWYFLGRGCNASDSTTVVDDTTNTETAAPVTPVDTTTGTAGRESMKVRLADNVEIDAYRGGIEDKLVNCLNDAGCKAGKDQWFDFDNINFETGSAQLTASSQAQINNIVAIMKAYPKAKIKIGGYTDKTGNDAANKKLSQDRAETVLNALKTGGVQESQLVGAEGYGSEFAKVPANASDEERRADRRIAVQLREK